MKHDPDLEYLARDTAEKVKEHGAEDDRRFAELDGKYAIKLVERIVFGLIGIIAVAVLYKLLSTINL